MKARSIRNVTAVLAVLGIAFGCYLWLRRNESTERKLVESVSRSERVFDQYFNGDGATACQAMLAHVEFLDRLSRESENQNRNPYAVDAMAWRVRLAKLDEKNGSDSAGYMQDAVVRCQKLGRSDCSEDTLRNQVDRADMVARAQLKKE